MAENETPDAPNAITAAPPSNPKKTAARTSYKYPKPPKKINWAEHKKWLAINAKPCPKQCPAGNPIGKYNQNAQIHKSAWDEFLSRNVKPLSSKELLAKKLKRSKSRGKKKKPKSKTNKFVKSTKKIDWARHNKWLETNAKPRPKRDPPHNPRGRFNRDQKLAQGVFKEFLNRNQPPLARISSSMLLMMERKQHTVSIKEFEQWYESRKPVPVPAVEPTRSAKPIGQLLKGIKRLSTPRKYVTKKPKTLSISPAALKFKGGKLYSRLSTPKPDLTPEIPPIVLNPITKHGMERLDELSKPVRKPEESKNSCYYLERWPFGVKDEFIENKRKLEESKKTEAAAEKNAEKSNKTKKTKPFQSKLLKQKPPVNVFVLFSKDSKCIIKPAEPVKTESCTGQCRIEELAKPTQPIAVPYKDRPLDDNRIPQRVLNHQPSNRLVELSQPKDPVSVPFETAKTEKEAKSKAHHERRSKQHEMERQERIRRENEQRERDEWEAEEAAMREEEERKKRKSSKKKNKKKPKKTDESNKSGSGDSKQINKLRTQKSKEQQMNKENKDKSQLEREDTKHKSKKTIDKSGDTKPGKQDYKAEAKKEKQPDDSTEDPPGSSKKSKYHTQCTIVDNVFRESNEQEKSPSKTTEDNAKTDKTSNKASNQSKRKDNKFKSRQEGDAKPKERDTKLDDRNEKKPDDSTDGTEVIYKKSIYHTKCTIVDNILSESKDQENVPPKKPEDKKQKRTKKTEDKTDKPPKMTESRTDKPSKKTEEKTDKPPKKKADTPDKPPKKTEDKTDTLSKKKDDTAEQPDKMPIKEKPSIAKTQSKTPDVTKTDDASKMKVDIAETEKPQPQSTPSSAATKKVSIKQEPSITKKPQTSLITPKPSVLKKRSQADANTSMSAKSSKTSIKSNVKSQSSKTRLPEKVKSDIDYRSDLENDQHGIERIERTRNPLQRVSNLMYLDYVVF